MRIKGNMSTQLGTAQQAQTSQKPRSGEAVAKRVQENLFGRVRPRLLQAADFPELAELLRMLNGYRRKFAALAGDPEADYTIVLADDAIAAIDEHGTIFMGVAFLKAHRRRPEVLVGALAHEIGHRPKRWRQTRYQIPRDLSGDQLSMLCRHEEIRADMFAGRALAEVGVDCEPVIAFLELVQISPHPAYLPVEERAQVIREAHRGGAYRAEARRKFFPAHSRHVGAKGYLGEY